MSLDHFLDDASLDDGPGCEPVPASPTAADLDRLRAWAGFPPRREPGAPARGVYVAIEPGGPLLWVAPRGLFRGVDCGVVGEGVVVLHDGHPEAVTS